MNIQQSKLLVDKINNKKVDLDTIHLCIVEDKNIVPVISLKEHAQSEFFTNIAAIEEQFDGVVYWDGESYLEISLAVLIIKLNNKVFDKDAQEDNSLKCFTRKTQSFLCKNEITSISQLRGNYMFFYNIRTQRIVFNELAHYLTEE
jgi:hypothetical protein